MKFVNRVRRWWRALVWALRRDDQMSAAWVRAYAAREDRDGIEMVAWDWDSWTETRKTSA